jgi:peptide/nickel transport system substrate-binding protein
MELKRVVAQAAALVGTALLVASCGSSSGGESKSGGSDGGKTLVVARTGDIDGLDIHRATAFQTLEGLDLMYDTLFELNKDLAVEPGLAETSEYSKDGKTLTIGLRKGVKFHDGTPLDSAAVKATLQRILDPENAITTASNLANVAKIDTPDDLTVVLDLKVPDASLPAALAHYSTSIMTAKDAKAESITKPNGTGPFTFRRWAQGEALHLTANPDYWGGKPSLSGVDIRVVPDESSILAGLRAGEFQIGALGDPTVVSQVSGDLKLESTQSLSYYVFAMNPSKGPLKEQKVRQAISCAIDRQEVIDAAASGAGKVTGPFTSPNYEFEPFAGLPCTPPDLEGAKRLLAEAGYPDGFTLKPIVLTGEHGVMPNISQSLQAQLEKIGVTIKAEMLETNTFVERWKKADFDSYITINGGWPDPHHMYVRYFASDGSLNNVAQWSSPATDKLFAKGLALTDQEARKPVYEELAAKLQEGSPWVWLAGATTDRALRPGVEGFVPMPNGSLKSLRDVELTG